MSVVALMDWRVHRIGTNWTFKKFVNTGGRVDNDTILVVGEVIDVLGRLGSRRKLRMEIEMGMMGQDLILVDSIRRCNAFNAIFFHSSYSRIPKATFLGFYTTKNIENITK